MLFIKSGKNSEKNDAELIAGYRSSKDPALIGLLFDRYSHLVFAVSMKYLKNEDDSKDAAIAIFEKLPKDLIKYEILNFSSWLHTVTKHHCFRLLSKKKFHSADTANIPEVIDEDEGFEKTYLPHLSEAILNLKDEQRICIELFYIDNMSYEEVSAKSGFSMLQVKSYIQNGKRNLKKEVERLIKEK
jgi:RNA polymerase sigma factor (sigma-70 family)